MVLQVKRRTVSVDVILDQDKAQWIVELGERLARERSNGRQVEGMVAGADTAKQIERLREDAREDTLTLELQALPYSQWRMVLEQNTPDRRKPYEHDLIGVTADSVSRMVQAATLGGSPVGEEDLTAEALHDMCDELTDGQLTILYRAVLDLNGKAADPKAAYDLASKTLNSSRN